MGNTSRIDEAAPASYRAYIHAGGRFTLIFNPITGHGKYIFPGRHDKNKPISENSIHGVIRRIGFDGMARGHGFRHQMSTISNEHSFDPELVECQLAHTNRNKVRKIYNHAQYLDKRRKMMQ